MNNSATPRPYEQWRDKPIERAEDAAYTFGFHLMQHCRAEAVKSVATADIPKNAEELRLVVANAVDAALHNVVDMLEGFWPTQAGSNYRVAYALSVCVRDQGQKTLERIDISPCFLDLPIGYWKWRDGEFQ